MEKIELIERAKMYLKLLGDGVHPVTGDVIPEDSAFMDEKVKRCFSFISQVLDEYVELTEKVEKLESEKEKNYYSCFEETRFFNYARAVR